MEQQTVSETRGGNVLLTQTRDLRIKVIPLVFQQYQKLPTDGQRLQLLGTNMPLANPCLLQGQPWGTQPIQRYSPGQL